MIKFAIILFQPCSAPSSPSVPLQESPVDEFASLIHFFSFFFSYIPYYICVPSLHMFLRKEGIYSCMYWISLTKRPVWIANRFCLLNVLSLMVPSFHWFCPDFNLHVWVESPCSMVQPHLWFWFLTKRFNPPIWLS